MTSPARNGLATAGLTLGLVSIFLFEIGLIPVLAVVFSGIGLNRGPAGKGKAVAGLVLGIIYTVVYLGRYGYLRLD